MDRLPYDNLSDGSADVTGCSVLARMVDALGFRYRWATEGLRETDAGFRPTPEHMTLLELLAHIDGLVGISEESLGGQKHEKSENAEIEALRERTLNRLSVLSQRLSKMTDSDLGRFQIRGHPFWNVVHGPLADALTHVGQINSLRRMNGNPCPKHSVFLGRGAS
jgi:hypothetical protein